MMISQTSARTKDRNFLPYQNLAYLNFVPHSAANDRERGGMHPQQTVPVTACGRTLHQREPERSKTSKQFPHAAATLPLPTMGRNTALLSLEEKSSIPTGEARKSAFAARVLSRRNIQSGAFSSLLSSAVVRRSNSSRSSKASCVRLPRSSRSAVNRRRLKWSNAIPVNCSDQFFSLSTSSNLRRLNSIRGSSGRSSRARSHALRAPARSPSR